MRKTVATVRPNVDSDGMISAFSMVKSFLRSGVPAENIKLIEQLTPAERTELGL